MPTKHPAPKRTMRQPRPARNYADEAKPPIIQLADIKQKKGVLADREKKVQEDIVELLQKAKQTSTTVEAGGKRVQAALVAGSSVVLDEDKLKNRLGAALWNKITTRALDRKKLDAFIASGEVKVTDVAACSDERPKSPYIKITQK